MESGNSDERAPSGMRAPGLQGALVVAAVIAALGLAASAGASGGGDFGLHCTRTAILQRAACTNEVADDYLEARAVCGNISGFEERRECLREARDDAGAANRLCRQQRVARLGVCDLIGEKRYDPDLDPEQFRTTFDDSNPFWPLSVGNQWRYQGAGEVIDVEVLDETKQIEGVTCITVRDTVLEDGVPLEDTDDWIALHDDGDAWYFGEISKNFELFEGDDPEIAELVDLEGSWKAGRDGAKPGVFVPANAPVGLTYRQEWKAGEAEDVATVLSRTYGYGNDPALDEHVPQALAELLCNDDCMVTRDFTPVDPDANELKYYAPGIGFFLEVKPEDGEIVQLTACNVDPRCASLPEPEEDE